MTRIVDTRRGTPLRLTIDGHGIESFAGETVATAMLADGQARFRDDAFGRPRGLLCNMGTCSECLVTLVTDARRIRTRACLLPVADGMRIETGAAS